MYKSGDVVLAQVQYTDCAQIKKRPALVLFEELENVVVAGITSNLNMKGIKLSKKDGMYKDSVIKINYIFTITEKAIDRKILSLGPDKKSEVYEQISKRISGLKK